MIPLLLSLCILVLVPWLYSKSRSWVTNIHQFEFRLNALILALILFGFLPQHLRRDGLYGLLFLTLAVLAFWLLEHLTHLTGKLRPQMLLYPLGLALFVHALFDGLGLSMEPLLEATASPHNHSHNSLVVAIVVHRVPASLGIWGFIYPRYGMRTAASMLGLLGMGTLAGFFIGSYQSHWQQPGHYPIYLEYVIAGGLVHFGRHSLLHWRRDSSTIPRKADQA
ncbi:MAG: hypothetical protein ACOH5I_07505 [Oligoflexus sp.]